MTAYALLDTRYIAPPTRRDLSAGVSEFAVRINDELKRTYQDLLRTAIGHQRLSDPLAELAAGYEESHTLGDSDERVMPSASAYNEAVELLGSLPSWVPPIPVMEPSGAIGFEWDFGRNRFFVLAVDGTGRIEYSAILGTGDDHHGTTNFAGAAPRRALDLLVELMKQ
jgi:hypothetical protein